MKELFFGEANRFTHPPFESGAQSQVQALHRGLTLLMLRSRQADRVSPPASANHCSTAHPAWAKTASKRRKVAGVRRPKTKASTCPVAAFSTPRASVAPSCSAQMTAFQLHTSAGPYRGRACRWDELRGPDLRLQSFFSSPMTVCGLMPSTRAVSRIPLPFSAKVVILSPTPGSCTLWRLGN